MRIQQSIGIQDASIKDISIQDISIQDQNNTGSGVKSNNGNKSYTTISAANLNGGSLVARRQSLAQKQALKVVSDAFNGEKKLDAQMQSIKDEINRLQNEINEKSANTRENDAKLKELQEEYGIDPDSEEHKELSVLAAKMRNPNVGVSEEEMNRLSEYQQKALYYVTTNQQNSLDVDCAKANQKANVQGYAEMKSERAKSQDMINAQDAAEDIMKAADGETLALLTQEAVEHVDEEQKEREEEAKEAAEKKKEEKKEEAKKLEKEAIQQEMIENIKEHAAENQRTDADIKRAIARRERAEADGIDSENLSKKIISEGTSLEDIQSDVNSEITNILNRLSLLSNDVKGSTIDNQI